LQALGSCRWLVRGFDLDFDLVVHDRISQISDVVIFAVVSRAVEPTTVTIWSPIESSALRQENLLTDFLRLVGGVRAMFRDRRTDRSAQVRGLLLRTWCFLPVDVELYGDSRRNGL
jgi:hypothetical protein